MTPGARPATFSRQQQIDRALALMQDRVVPDFLHDPVMPAALDLSKIAPSLLADAPDRLLALAGDLLIWGDTARGGEYLDLLERVQPSIPPESSAGRPAGGDAVIPLRRCSARLDGAIAEAVNARAIQGRTLIQDEWTAVVPLILLRVYNCLEDFQAIEREAAAALALPALTEPAKLVLVPGARALAWFSPATWPKPPTPPGPPRRRPGGWDSASISSPWTTCARWPAWRWSGGTSTPPSSSPSERCRSPSGGGPSSSSSRCSTGPRSGPPAGRSATRWRPSRPRAWSLPGARPALLARADELEALLRLSLGDLRSAGELASGLPAARRGLLLARIALAAGDHHGALEHLQSPSLAELTPRLALVRQILLAAAAIGRGDPMADGILGGALQAAHQGGFLNTVVTTAPQVTGYLVEHAAQALRPDPFIEQLIGAALEVRAAQSAAARSRPVLAEPLTAAEMRILKLLPTSTYLQMAATLYISRNTVKTQLRSIYQKLGVASRSEAIERAVDLQLL